MWPSSMYFSYFRKMVFPFSSPPFYMAHVKMPAQDDIQLEIRNNLRFWPYFKDAIGALDESHIHAAPPAKDRGAFQNRKGFVSQNCLFACSFNLQFTYSLTGWEGPATDAHVFQDAHEKDLHIKKANIFWPTLDIHIAPSFLYLIGTLTIILQSGSVQH